MDINILASHVYFDMPEQSEISKICEGFIKGGVVSDNLNTLVLQDTHAGIKEIIIKLFDELSIDLPSHKEAGILLAKYYAQSIIEESVEPYKGARLIWDAVEAKEENEGEFEDLSVFTALASEYEDFNGDEQISFYGKDECLLKQKGIADEIIREAKILVG